MAGKLQLSLSTKGPATHVCGAFFRAISAYVHTIPPPRVISINAAKGGVFPRGTTVYLVIED